MAVAGDVVINFAAETAKFTAELKKVRSELKVLQDSVNGVVGTLGKVGTAFKAAIIGAGIVTGFRAIVTATEESDAAIAQLDAALKSASSVVRTSSQDFQVFAKSLQATTTFTDEAVTGVETVLLSFRSLTGGVIKDATRAVLDLSTRLGTDLTSSAKLVGRALEDPEKGMAALARAGVVFSSSQKALIKQFAETGQKAQAQAIILQELEKRFGGAAEAARNTLGGALKGLSNAFGDLLEGDKNSFSKATQSINELTKAINNPNIKKGFDNLITSAAKVLEVVARLASALTGVGNLIGSALSQPGSELTASQALQRELEIRQEILRNARVSGFVQAEAFKVEEQYNETLRQRIEIAKQIEASQKNSTKELEKQVLVSQGHGTIRATADVQDQDTEKILAKFKQQESFIELRQKIVSNSIQQAGQALDALDVAMGDGEHRLTEMNELARKQREQSLAQFSKDQIDASVAEFDRRLRLETEHTDAVAEQARRRVQIEQEAAQQRIQTNENVVIASVAALTFLVSGHGKAQKAINAAQKIAALIEIYRNTAVGATKALSAYPPPWGFAAAAAVVAFGAIQASAVLSEKAPNSRGGGSAAQFTGTTTPTASVGTDVATGATQNRQINVTFEGVVTREAARAIADALKDIIDGSDVHIIGPQSSQALMLKG